MSEMIVKFHEWEQIADEHLKFAVIAAKHEGKWIFCRHKERDTYEIPGGHREGGESIDDTAKRELVEETGAVRFSVSPICVYSVTNNKQTTYGKLYFAEILELGSLSLQSEIAEIGHFSILPDTLTYPAIQPVLYGKVQEHIASLFKDGKWAKETISLQKPDGSWGFFHTLSEPNKAPMTTEQALRRLSILGYTIEDECISKAVDYMNDCLMGKKEMPDRREKLHDWNTFTDLMLSTWIRRFTKDCPMANKVADRWARLISSAFVRSVYDHAAYTSAYLNIHAMKPKGARLVDFVSFYQVSLIKDCLDEKIESAVVDYMLNHKKGIYYMYDGPLTLLPDTFASKQASRYLAAMELMASYRRNSYKLQFVVEWLNKNRNENGKWDMGAMAKDGVYFPLSNDWRRKGVREFDCTYRVQKFIDEVTSCKCAYTSVVR